MNCTKVTTSPQSYVFGIPVAVLGLAFYVFAVAIMSPWAWRSMARREVGLIRLALAVVGIGFVLYLLYAELFISAASACTAPACTSSRSSSSRWSPSPPRPGDCPNAVRDILFMLTAGRPVTGARTTLMALGLAY